VIASTFIGDFASAQKSPSRGCEGVKKGKKDWQQDAAQQEDSGGYIKEQFRWKLCFYPVRHQSPFCDCAATYKCFSSFASAPFSREFDAFSLFSLLTDAENYFFSSFLTIFVFRILHDTFIPWGKKEGERD